MDVQWDNTPSDLEETKTNTYQEGLGLPLSMHLILINSIQDTNMC